MITVSDVGKIIYDDCAVFAMSRYLPYNIPYGEVEGDGRIVIRPKKQGSEEIFRKGFVEVNFAFPDIQRERNVALDDIQRSAVEHFSDVHVGKFNEEWYRYSLFEYSEEEDKQLECHYVNIKLYFEILNISR